jgi:hypothetical protein
MTTAVEIGRASEARNGSVGAGDRRVSAGSPGEAVTSPAGYRIPSQR